MTKEVTMAQVADKVVDKTSDVIALAADKATDLFTAAAGVLSDATAKYGAQVIDAVLWTVRLDGIQSLLTAFIWTLVGVWILYMIWGKKWNFGTSRDPEYLRVINSDNADAIGMASLISLVPIIILSISISVLADVWKWTQVFKPEIYLVKKTMDIVEKKISENGK